MRVVEQRSFGGSPFRDPGRSHSVAWLRIGGWAALGAGVAGSLGLLSVIPWPELFSLHARPANVIAVNPGLQVVLVGHYVILAVGGLLGWLAGVVLTFTLRSRVAALLGAPMLAGASAALGYATTVRAVDLLDGRAVEDVEAVVWAGGSVLLVAVVILTLTLRRQTGTGFLLLGLGAPMLVVAGIVTFMVIGPDFYPEIWGVTFPPPTDYLLAIWFVALGRVMQVASREPLGRETA